MLFRSVNLREEQLPHKRLIGQVLLDKNAPRVRTVVNKLAEITDEYRVFPMEVLAGEESLVTSVRENDATFSLDYRTVYWNSRLEAEHRRVARGLLPADAVVCDMMAGIGPFAVPAAMRGCRVYANDLNPESARWLRANVDANRGAVGIPEFGANACTNRDAECGPDRAVAPRTNTVAGPSGVAPTSGRRSMATVPGSPSPRPTPRPWSRRWSTLEVPLRSR